MDHLTTCQCPECRKHSRVMLGIIGRGCDGSVSCGENYHVYTDLSGACACGKQNRGSIPLTGDPIGVPYLGPPPQDNFGSPLTPVQQFLKGWQCPVCNAGNSPYIVQCPCSVKIGK